jgi:DNA polymerase-3 subunit alpha
MKLIERAGGPTLRHALRPRPARGPQARRQAPAGDAGARGRLRPARPEPPARLRGLDALVAYSAASTTRRLLAGVALRRRGRRPARAAPAHVPDWDAPERLARSSRRWASTSRATRSTTTCRPQAHGREPPREVVARAQEGPHRGQGRGHHRAGAGAHLAARQPLRLRRAVGPLGQFEVTLFSEALEAARPHLEPGNRVVIQVEATQEGEGVRLMGAHRDAPWTRGPWAARACASSSSARRPSRPSRGSWPGRGQASGGP